MKLKLKFTTSARAQFLAAITYIRAENPAAAAHFRERAGKALRRLEAFPDSGRSLPEFPDLPHREVIVDPYRFFYRVAESTVWIIGVWHSRQRPEAPR